jgi:ComF family protein
MGMDRLNRIAGAALDLIYPPALYCVCCGKIIDETRCYRLCNECMDGMKWIGERTCTRCGKRLSDINPGELCFSCRENPHNFDRGFTCAEYGTHERALVFALKYDDRPDIADTIGEIMADRMLSEFTADELAGRYDLVLPVPVHPRKLRIRGYNQAALIAARFAGLTGLRTEDDVITRTKETHVMKSLSPDQRRENIRGAFAIRNHRRHEIEGRNILLIDDIYTTGATVDEIASLLKEPWEDMEGNIRSGAASVDVLTFAAGADVIKAPA